MSTTTSNPYQIFNDLKKAGWYKNFDDSLSGELCVTVDGAPSLGSSPGNLLFFGHFIKPDGTSIFQRSNMDRSISTVIFDPMGNLIHSYKHATLIEAADCIRSLNII